MHCRVARRMLSNGVYHGHILKDALQTQNTPLKSTVGIRMVEVYKTFQNVLIVIKQISTFFKLNVVKVSEGSILVQVGTNRLEQVPQQSLSTLYEKMYSIIADGV